MRKHDKEFWDTVARAKAEVATWPAWKQRIVITAETISTGRFLKPEVVSEDTTTR